MTVKELRAKIEGMPDDMPVFKARLGEDGEVDRIDEVAEADELVIATSRYVPPDNFPQVHDRGGPQNVSPLNIVTTNQKALVLR